LQVYRPYAVLPRQDRAFLESRPDRAAVMQRFGQPAEELQAGQHFPMTAWHPPPDRETTGSALSFVRRYGSKLYLYSTPKERWNIF
jgi:hypothetical protein